MPSIGKDLTKIRKHLGLTLQDIQFATKLPQHTLQKIEDDSIFVDAEEGPIYTRNFVRSYGRVLKIDDNLLIEALNLREAGKYNHELLSDFPELTEKTPESEGNTETAPASVPSADEHKKPQKRKSEQKPVSEQQDSAESQPSSKGDDESSEPESATVEQEPEKKSEEKPRHNPETAKPTQKTSDKPSKKSVDSDTGKKTAASEKKPNEVDWADVGQKIHQEKKQVPAWLAGLIILVVVLGVAGYVLYQSGIFSSEPSPREEVTAPADETAVNSLSIELDEPQQQEPPQTEETLDSQQPAVVLDDTLNVVVYAAYGNVDPVRVWSDTKPRFDPYWIEEGSAMTFDFIDSVQVRGPYDNMLLFLNGHLIENPVQNYYSEENDYVELNRSIFTSDTRWSETTELQVPEGVNPPNEIRSRPTFN